MATRPVAAFVIRPGHRSRLHALVEVYASVSAFRRRVREDAKTDGTPMRTRGLVGCCYGVTERDRKTKRKTGLFAILKFPRQHLTMSTLTHECFHATMRWAERKGLGAIETKAGRSNMRQPTAPLSLEEQCATVHDRLCAGLVRALITRGLAE